MYPPLPNGMPPSQPAHSGSSVRLIINWIGGLIALILLLLLGRYALEAYFTPQHALDVLLNSGVFEQYERCLLDGQGGEGCKDLFYKYLTP